MNKPYHHLKNSYTQQMKYELSRSILSFTILLLKSSKFLFPSSIFPISHTISIEKKNDRRLYCPLSPINRWLLLFIEMNLPEILNLTLVLISSFKNAYIQLKVSLILTTIIRFILISLSFSSSIKYKLSKNNHKRSLCFDAFIRSAKTENKTLMII